MTTPARKYMAARAINPHLAHELGVKLEGDDLVFPNGKRRPLSGDVRFLNGKGQPAQPWWLQNGGEEVLVCEGESDGLAALSALRSLPADHRSGLRSLAVVAIPGNGFPLERLTRELRGYKLAYTAFDNDDSGRAYNERATDALVDARVRPVDLWGRGDADANDLAEWLAAIPEYDRGEFLAALIVDAEAVAPSLKQHHARRLAAYYRERAEEWEQLAA